MSNGADAQARPTVWSRNALWRARWGALVVALLRHHAPVHPVDALVRRVGALAVVISLAAVVAEVLR